MYLKMAADFKKYNVNQLQQFLTERGIHLSDGGKRKKATNL